MRLTVSRRIALGFGIILGLALIPVIVGVIALEREARAYDDALTQERTVVQAALQAEATASKANLEYLRYLVSGNGTFAAAFERETTLTAERIRTVTSAAMTRQTRAPFTDAARALEEWRVAARASIATAERGDRAGALAAWEARVLPARNALGNAIQRGEEAAGARSEETVAAAKNAAKRMRTLLLASGFLALLIGGISAWLLNGAIAGPLRETTQVLASNAAEILAATTQQAASASETSAAVAETSATVNEVAQTTEHAAERARVVADLAKRASEIGKSGRQAIDNSITAMDSVKEQVERIAGSIMTLAEQAQAIGEIVTTVNDVADQTNLLALNAAVEAARSGEHGRGFAVVAAEIRTLAEEAKRSTVQVRQILGEIQRATNAAVLTTELGSTQVAGGSRQVEQAGETIRSLVEAVAEAAQAAAQIVASAGEQAVGMAQVREAMGNIEQATQQTVASTRQAEAAARDLNRMGTRLVELVGEDQPSTHSRRA